MKLKIRFLIEKFLCIIFGHEQIIQDDPYRYPCRFCDKEDWSEYSTNNEINNML